MQETWIQGNQGERFLVRQELGRGAMGLVLLADEAPSGRRVVLKILLHASGPALERFAREGEVAARLQHPGIVPIHHAGTLLDGRAYLCFAHVQGARDLESAFLQASLERRLEWLMEAGAALGHAHQQGVVHRDLKLANLLIDSGGRVRVADFGVALLSDHERLTQTGALVGTPHTMAPEQATGQKDAVGPASDVWALGVLLYLACAERYPFEGSNQVEVLQAIVGGQAKPLTGVPRAIREVVTRALERDPERRYADGSEFADALELATLAGEAARSPIPLLVGALVVTVAVGVGIGLALRPAAESAEASPRSTVAIATPSPSSPAPSTPTASEPESPAQLLAEAKALASTGRSGVRGAYLRAAQAGSLEAQEYLSVRGPQPAREFWRARAAEGGSASAACALGKSLVDTDPKLARSWLLRAAEADYRPAMVPLSRSYRDERAGPVEPVNAERWIRAALLKGDPEALLGAARNDFRQGRRDKAVERVRQAVAEDYGEAYIQLGRWQARGWEGAPPDLDAAEASLRRALELETPDAAGYLAIVLHDNGKSPEAERLLQERVASGDRLCLAQWGRVLYFYMGRREEGLEALRRAAAPRPAHPQVDLFLGRVLASAGRYKEAEPYAVSASKGGVLEGKLLVAELCSRRGAKREARAVLLAALREGLPMAGLALTGVAETEEERFRFLQGAIALHDPQTLLMFSKTAAEKKRFDECRDYLERAVASGDTKSHLLLAAFHERGVFGKPDLRLAEKYWLGAARRRSCAGAVGFAKFVAGRPKSPRLEEAKHWLAEACKTGDRESLALKRSLGW